LKTGGGVELADLPAPPTLHTLHINPSTLRLPFPFQIILLETYKFPPTFRKSVSNSRKQSKVT